jgi:hypothetical protein
MATQQSALELAEKLRKKYTKENGQLWDGGLSDSLIDYVGPDSTAEDALNNACSITEIVLKQYKCNKKLRAAIDSHYAFTDGTGEAKIKALKQFHHDIFNYHCPGYLELLRMEKDPGSRLLAENLEYFEGLYIDEDWKVDIGVEL